MAFQQPNYTQYANFILDDHMSQLSGAEFKIISWIIRKTCGFHRTQAAIPYSEFSEKCGIEKSWVIKSCAKFVDSGWIKILKQKGTKPNVYQIVMEGDSKNSSSVDKTPEGCCENTKEVVSEHHYTESLKKDLKKKETTEEQAAPVEVSSEKEIKLQKKQALEELGVLTSGEIMSLMNRTLEDILKACGLFKLEKKVDTPVKWLSACMANKEWLNGNKEKVKGHNLYDQFISAMKDLQKKAGIYVMYGDNESHINLPGFGGIEVKSHEFESDKYINDVLKCINDSLMFIEKVVYVNLPTKQSIEVMK